MKSIKKRVIYVDAIGGSVIDNCIDESIILCIEEKTNVILIHNDKQFTINYREILRLVEGTMEKEDC